jgi:hypothetical protein
MQPDCCVAASPWIPAIRSSVRKKYHAKQHVNLNRVVFRGSLRVKAIYFNFFTTQALRGALAGS